MNKSQLQDIMKVIKRGTVEIIPEEELKEKIKKSAKKDRPLIVKLGADPSAPDIHLGHYVVLKKLRQLQELGHEIVFIIGDFTGMIGDPSGKSETRNQLTREEVEKNAETYKEQVFKILDPAKTRIEFNSKWFKDINIYDFLELSSKYTVARMLERDDFEKRFQAETPISILEFLYPLVQAYDSVAIESDIELGGTDQKFNLLVGREIQSRYDQEPQVIITMPLLIGLDGKKKMSKSLNNYIGITESPDEMFGKVMSIPDDLMEDYFILVTDFSEAEIESKIEGMGSGKLNPRNVKEELGKYIVELFHSKEDAEQAAQNFINLFRKGKTPDDIPESEISEESMPLADLIFSLNLTDSKGQAKRLIKSNAVSINDEKITENKEIEIKDGMILKVGKRRFARIKKG